ncbi:zinc ribbon domain-containing protein [Chloroflexota bacterium]
MEVPRKTTVSYELYRPVMRLIVGLVILAIINWILTSLPMVAALRLPWLPVSINAIISSVIGIIMISMFLTFRRDFVPRLESAMPSFTELADIVHAAVNLSVIIIAYIMFDDIILPFMKDFAWVYPLVFLALAIWPLVSLITGLYRSSGKIADLATFRIAEVRGELVMCTSCGAIIPRDARYCTKCSAQVAGAVTIVPPTKCSVCGVENKTGDIYCLACGSPLSSKEDDKGTKVK